MPPCLVLVDPSPAATGALRWAANNLDVGAQAIHLVHVVTPKPMVVAGGMGAGMLVEAIHEEVRRPPVLPPRPREADARRVQNEVQKKSAKQFMQRVRVDAKSLGFTDVHCTILIASPGAGHAAVGRLVQECVSSEFSRAAAGERAALSGAQRGRPPADLTPLPPLVQVRRVEGDRHRRLRQPGPRRLPAEHLRRRRARLLERGGSEVPGAAGASVWQPG